MEDTNDGQRGPVGIGEPDGLEGVTNPGIAISSDQPGWRPPSPAPLLSEGPGSLGVKVDDAGFGLGRDLGPQVGLIGRLVA
jgi:hypothetical protein